MSQDYYVEGQVSEADGDVITLRINRPGDRQMQKAPNGGQYGHGFEQGNQWSPYLSNVDYDYKVKDLCIFFYQQSANTTPINSNRFTPILAKDYVSEEDIQLAEKRLNDGHPDHATDAQYELNFSLLHRILTNYKVVALANVGDITNKVHYLGDLRDYLPAESFSLSTDADKGTFVYASCDPTSVSVDGGSYSSFAMSIYEEPTFVVGKGTLEEPHKVEITLERLAARVDFNINNFPSLKSQKADAFSPIPYEVKAVVGGTPTTLAKNWITHCRLVNSMQQPSYCIRRTADDPNTVPTQSPAVFLGTEKAVNNISQNYVLAPHTRDITTQNTYSLFGGSSLTEAMKVNFTDAERVVSRKAYAPYDGGYEGTVSALAFDNTSPNYFVIGYTNENTLRPEDMTRNYATGLLYRSIFEPSTVYRLNEARDGLVEETLALTEDVLSDGSTPAGGIKSDHYGKTFWMMERLVPNPTEADRVYFVADDPGDQNGDGITTDAGKTKIMKAAQLYMADHNETGWTQPLEYVGGVAYNYYWIRHSNSQGTGHPFSPMEYSIVRNNIYSVSITSFSGPGAPSTDYTMDNPDRIQPITYVHKWHPYTVEEVGM